MNVPEPMVREADDRDHAVVRAAGRAVPAGEPGGAPVASRTQAAPNPPEAVATGAAAVT